MINIRAVTWMLNSDYSEKEFEIIEKVNLKFDNSEFFVRTKRATFPCISEPLDLKNIDYLNTIGDLVNEFDVGYNSETKS